MGASCSRKPRSRQPRPVLQQDSWRRAAPMPPSQNDKAAADALRAEGNILFAKGKYAAACERYTEALTLHPVPALLTNRAFCHKKRSDWERVADDSRAALEMDGESMKGHYYLGIALRETHDMDAACIHLTKALELARSSGDSIKDEIWRELASAKYQHWEAKSAQRTAEREKLRARLGAALAALQDNEPGDGWAPLHADGVANGRIHRGDYSSEQRQRHEAETAALDELFTEAAARDTPSDFSSAFACRLTLEPFREPVTTPAGLSYERSALLTHLRNVGNFDPVTREPCTEAQVVYNLGLRAATQEYLDQNPWAWKDCI